VPRKKKTSKESEGNKMVWSDKTGTYKLGYSQYLQQKMLKVNILLLVSVVILILMLIVGFIYANSLIQRIDALDLFSRMAEAGLVS